jgi:hypothetical protein
MALRTTDFTFADFVQNRFPSIIADHTRYHISFYTADVIEVETNGIAFSTIYAGMRFQVLPKHHALYSPSLRPVFSPLFPIITFVG